MEIYGVGVDLIEVARIKSAIERHASFIKRIFVQEELKFSNRGVLRYEELAGRFAAKEAVLKALKVGWRQGIGFVDIVVLNEKSGAPYVVLQNRAKKIAEELGIKHVFVSISHTKELAIGLAIAVL